MVFVPYGYFRAIIWSAFRIAYVAADPLSAAKSLAHVWWSASHCNFGDKLAKCVEFEAFFFILVVRSSAAILFPPSFLSRHDACSASKYHPSADVHLPRSHPPGGDGSRADAGYPLINPLAAGVPVPGMLLPSARAQPASFVVGPGFLPISDKMVSNIVSGQYIDLAALLAKPSEVRSTSPLICVDGQVVVSTAPKPPRRLTDIAQWLQAFAIYMLVMVTYAPHRAADLIRYQLLILRTHSQFGGLAWYNYDEAFRRDAAARQVVDWSGMHVELYNFHTASTSRGSADVFRTSFPREC